MGAGEGHTHTHTGVKLVVVEGSVKRHDGGYGGGRGGFVHQLHLMASIGVLLLVDGEGGDSTGQELGGGGGVLDMGTAQ